MLGQVAERLRTAGGGGVGPAAARAGVGGRRRRARRGRHGAAGRRRGRGPRHGGCASTCGVATPGVVEPRRAGPRRARPRPGAARRGIGRRRAGCRLARVLPAPGGCRGARRSGADAARPAGAVTGPGPAAPTWCCSAPPPRPEQRVAWVAATDAWQLTVVDRRPRGRRCGRWPTGSPAASLGLALAGGGARAFAHVGVLRELEDAGLHVDRVTGTSIGAIIAGLHATGIDGGDPRGGLLRGVRAPPAVQRLPALRPAPWPAGGGCTPRWSATTAPTPCSRGCPASCRWSASTWSAAPGRCTAAAGCVDAALASLAAARAVRARSPRTTGGCSSTAGCSTTCPPTCSSSATRGPSWR